MRISFTPLILLSILAACAKPVPPAPPSTGIPTAFALGQLTSTPATAPAKPVLSIEGYGPVRFGTQLSKIKKLLDAKAEPLSDNDPTCSLVRIKAVPVVRFMVENGIVTRADADPGTPNSLKLTVGDTLAHAQEKYPALEVGPQKYLPTGHYLTLKSPDGGAAIIMEEDGKAITKIRAGPQPAVGYVERCL